MSKPKKEKKEEVEWDKKKIIIFSILAIFFIVSAVYIKDAFLGESTPTPKVTEVKQVKGVSTQDIASGIRQSVQSNINNLKTEVENLDVAEVASSSPQVQKILNDLKSIKDVPSSQLKSACEKVCSGL